MIKVVFTVCHGYNSVVTYFLQITCLLQLKKKLNFLNVYWLKEYSLIGLVQLNKNKHKIVREKERGSQINQSRKDETKTFPFLIQTNPILFLPLGREKSENQEPLVPPKKKTEKNKPQGSLSFRSPVLYKMKIPTKWEQWLFRLAKRCPYKNALTRQQYPTSSLLFVFKCLKKAK